MGSTGLPKVVLELCCVSKPATVLVECSGSVLIDQYYEGCGVHPMMGFLHSSETCTLG